MVNIKTLDVQFCISSEFYLLYFYKLHPVQSVRVVGMEARSLLLLILLALLPIPAFPSEGQVAVGGFVASIETSGDTYIDSQYPTSSFGNSRELTVALVVPDQAHVFFKDTLINFDIYGKVPPGAEVTSAKLILTVKSPTARSLGVEVRPLTKPFTESSATWNSHNHKFGDLITRVFVSSSQGQGSKVEFDVTNYIKDLVREGKTFFGFYLTGYEPSDEVRFFSSEGAPDRSSKPILSVSFRNPTIELVPTTSTLPLKQGQSSRVPVTVTGTFKGTAQISHEWVGNAPQGVFVSFSPQRGSVAFNTIMEVKTDISCSTGNFKLKIVARNAEGDYLVSGEYVIDLRISSAGTQTTTTETTSQPAAEAPFSISLQPDTLTVVKGELAQYSVLIERTGAFTGDIRLIPLTIPPGSTITFLIEGSNVYVRVQTSHLTPSGTYTVTVRATGDGYEAQDTAELVVTETGTQTTTTQPAASFSLRLSRGSVEVFRSGSAELTATVTGSGGFSSPVTLSVSGLPSGISISTDVNNINPNFTAHLLVSASPDAPLGSHAITIVATGGGLTSSAQLSVTVREAQPTTSAPAAQPSISVSLSQTSLTLSPGESASVVVTVNSSTAVDLSLSGAPAEVSYRFEPARLSGSGLASLYLTAGQTTGNFTLVVRASGEGSEGWAILQLTIRKLASLTGAPTVVVTTTTGEHLDPTVLGISAALFIAIILAALLLRRTLPSAGEKGKEVSGSLRGEVTSPSGASP